MTTLAAASASVDWLVSAGVSSPLKVWCLPAAGADLGNLKKARLGEPRASISVAVSWTTKAEGS